MKKTFTALLIIICLFLCACNEVTSEIQDTQNSTQADMQTDDVNNAQEESLTETMYFNSPIVTTGQAETYDADGNIIDTSNGFSGQDADYEKLDFDFKLNDDGTTYDANTGLTWVSIPDSGKMTWEQAVEYCENLTFAGYDDWRLPDAKELQSIVSYDGSYPAINQNYFTCTELEENENYYYWTSTSAYFSDMAPEYDSAWYVAFGYTSHGAGAVRFSPKYVGSDAISEGGDNTLNSVRLVRTIS